MRRSGRFARGASPAPHWGKVPPNPLPFVIKWGGFGRVCLPNGCGQSPVRVAANPNVAT